MPLIVVSLALGIAYVIVYFGKDFTSSEVLKSFFTNIYAWLAVLAILGCGRAWLSKESLLGRYMNRSGYGFYVLHYSVALPVCYYLKGSSLPVVIIYIAALAAVFMVTPVIFEVVGRLPVFCWLVLGIRRRKNA